MSYQWSYNSISGDGRGFSLSPEALSQIERDHGANTTNVAALILCWSSLLLDSPFDAKPTKVVNRFVFELVNDLFGTIAKFSSLYDLLVRVDLTDHAMIGEALKAFRTTPIFREVLKFVRTGEARCLTFIGSFLLYGKKLFYEAKELESTAFRAWELVEQRLELDLDTPIVRNIQFVMKWIFKNWDVSDLPFLPKHGGGAVAQRGVSGIIQKNEAFEIPRKLHVMYRRYMEGRTGEAKFDIYPRYFKESSDTSASCSRLKFVPKNWKTMRSICMEPVVYQWAQQGVRLWYEDYLSECVLKNHVDIRDQGKSQVAALLASKARTSDTIDLSSASDSVSWELCKRIFPKDVLVHLSATRTTMVETPSGEKVQLRKFAPMGSALCFPVQSTIYSAIVLTISLCRALGRDWRSEGALCDVDLDAVYSDVYGRPTGLYRGVPRYDAFICYGDDIILDHRVTSNTIECLRSLGFEVNEGKSFVGSVPFRESCGMYAYDGVDVTPLIAKFRKIGERLDASALASLIEQANRAFEYGFLNLRKALINMIQWYPIEGVSQKRGPNPILFKGLESTESFGIVTIAPRNVHLRKRVWAVNATSSRTNDTRISLQRSELRSIVPRPMAREEYVQEDNYLHTVWWRSRYHGGGKGADRPLPVAADTLRTGIAWRWSPTQQ